MSWYLWLHTKKLREKSIFLMTFHLETEGELTRKSREKKLTRKWPKPGAEGEIPPTHKRFTRRRNTVIVTRSRFPSSRTFHHDDASAGLPSSPYHLLLEPMTVTRRCNPSRTHAAVRDAFRRTHVRLIATCEAVRQQRLRTRVAHSCNSTWVVSRDCRICSINIGIARCFSRRTNIR